MRNKNTSQLTHRNTELYFNVLNKRNIINIILSIIAGICSLIALTPLFLVIIYVFIKGGSQLNLSLLTNLPEPPGDDILSGGGIGNAIIGTFIVTSIGASIAIPIGVGGGIYLAEFSKNGLFAKFIRFGTNVLAGVPSIIAGVFIYGLIVSTKILFNSNFSALAGGIALSILMLPTIIKTTDESLKLVSDDLRKAALAVGASKFMMITKITLPNALTPITTGVILAISRSIGETAPLIFTALFSFYWLSSPQNILEPIATLSVLIYNFALEPYQSQNELAWAASFILLMIIIIANTLAKSFASNTNKR